MLILLSPAKRMISLKEDGMPLQETSPLFHDEANRLASLLKQYSPKQLESRLDVKPQLALKAASFFAAWQKKPMEVSVTPALLAYNGDVFRGLSASTLSKDAWAYALNHLRIFSAMYGILRPSDNIQPYRLEMVSKIKPNGVKNLYKYWEQKITSHINQQLKKLGSNVIINLSSDEYFTTLNLSGLKARVIQPVFKEFRAGEYKSLFIYLKFARGRMTRYILENKLKDPEEIKAFDWEGYLFDPNLSEENRWVFTR